MISIEVTLRRKDGEIAGKKKEVGSETKDRIDESEIEDDMDTGWSQVEGGRIKSVGKTTKKKKKDNEEDSSKYR